MRVRVVGGGIIGLTCALRLREAGHEVGLVTAELPEQTTSAVAAAIWYPYRAYPIERVGGWGARTFEVLVEMSGQPECGVDVRAGRELLRTFSPDPWWRDAVPELGRVTDLPDGYSDGFALTVPVVDMTVHLAWLSSRLHALGVTVTQKTVADLEDATTGVDVVVNCTGLAAGELAGDTSLVPVRGQVVVVEQIGLQQWTLDKSDPQRLTYVVPRRDTIVLGGTAEEGRLDLDVDPATADAIVQRCTALVPELAEAQVVAHRVGLRPTRPTVRLEREGPQLIHCYGHGGAGVTLAYGCAEEVTTLVSQAP